MNLYCVFTPLRNLDLVKHVGVTPHLLSKEYGYNSTIVCFNNDEYTNLDLVPEVNLEFVDKKFKISFLNQIFVFIYLMKNAKNIDILQVYHYRISTVCQILIYRIFNRNGIIFLTLDMEYKYALMFSGNTRSLHGFIKTKLLIFLLKYVVDIISIETKKAYDVFIDSHDIFKEKLIYMPPFVEPNPNIDEIKKNQIISVGNLGTYHKASDTVLESFKRVLQKVHDENWVLKMVGPVTDDFKEYVDVFLSENPTLKDSVIFTGNIEDRDELYRIYSESKILCLPSRSETFCIVFVEALFYSDYLIITDVGIGKYLIDKSGFGQIAEIDDVEDISNKLIDAIQNYDNYYKNNEINHKELIKQEFSHEKYIKNLDCLFRKIKSNR